MIDFSKYEDEDYLPIKKGNRRAKIDKRAKAHEDFMRMNGRGLLTVTLPVIEKKGKTR